MPLRYSYTDAADRLIADAVVLWMEGRRENAAHLAGLSAECMLKSIFIGIGLVTPDPDGQVPGPKSSPRPTRNLRIHLDKLWSEFSLQLHGRAGAAYLHLLPAGDPFKDWFVDHRYVAASQLGDEDMQRWTWAAVALKTMLFEVARNKSPKEVQ